MDWADDIAYAVHDVEDFFRAGLIPLSRLANLDRRDLEPLFALVKEKWEPKRGAVPTDEELLEAAGITLSLSPENEAFRGTRGEQAALYQYSSSLIGRFVRATTFAGELQIERKVAVEVGLLKQLTGLFVISDPSLQTQQEGQRRVVAGLFECYMDSLVRSDTAILPPRVVHTARQLIQDEAGKGEMARLAADTIAGMTEVQAVRVYHRLVGVNFGTLLDPSVL